MLTQGTAPDAKCKFNISSLLTLPITIRFHHLCQGYFDHCVFTRYGERMARLGVVHLS